MKRTAICIASLLIWAGCSDQPSADLPEYAQDLQNVTIYSEDAEPAYRLHLEPELAFGDTEEVMVGSPGRLSLDEEGRVFIGDMQQNKIHVFLPNGEFIASVGGEGEGPGEFQWLGTMQIHSNYLYVYDPNSRRLSAFDISESLHEAPEFSHSIPIDEENFSGLPEESFMLPHFYRFQNDGYMILTSRHSMNQFREDPEFEGVERYYRVDPESDTPAEKIIELDMPEHIVTEMFIIPPPFVGRGLMTVSNDDRIFSVWTDDILIKEHSPDGEYVRAFYHPFANLELSRDEAIDSMDDFEELHEAVRSSHLPDTWPAVERLLIDDENRLWIATKVDEPDMHEWWVMGETGELLAQFDWPEDQSIRQIQNGSLYTRETDEESGLDQIVRYKVELDEGESR